MLLWQLLSYIERFRIHSERSEWIRADSEVSQFCGQATRALGTQSVDTLEGTHNFGQYYPLVIYYLS